MIKLFRQRWWKFVAIPFLLYAIISGFLIPLGPGITKINPDSTPRGTVISVDIFGYNTHFKEDDESLNVVLKNDNNLICANEVFVVNENELNVEFGLPQDLFIEHKKDFYNVVIYDEKDGTFFLRKGFAIERKDDNQGVKFQCSTKLEVTQPTGMTFPYREILYESIRNLYFHVPMWFTMIFLMLFSFISSINFLRSNKPVYDVFASEAARVGLFFGTMGILTGMQWAKMTWGAPWVNDPKLNGAAAGLLIYLAYFVLRGSLENEQTRGKVSAVYNVFAFVIFIVFILVIPRMTDTLHPGSGGNPGFNMYDLDNQMRPVFYSSVTGFIILAFWIASIAIRYRLLKNNLDLERT